MMDEFKQNKMYWGFFLFGFCLPCFVLWGGEVFVFFKLYILCSISIKYLQICHKHWDVDGQEYTLDSKKGGGQENAAYVVALK